MYLAPNFLLDEFLVSEVAVRKGIDNSNPPPEVIDNLRGIAGLLQRVRDKLKRPIIITSGWRCEELNKAVGGRPNSDHILGYAVDFICPTFGTPRQLAEYIRKNFDFGQLIYEGNWVHMSTRAPEIKYNKILTAVFTPGKPTVYKQGIV